MWLTVAIAHGFFAVFFVLVVVARIKLGESAWSVAGAVGMVGLFGYWAAFSFAKYGGRPLLTAKRENRERH